MEHDSRGSRAWAGIGDAWTWLVPVVLGEIPLALRFPWKPGFDRNMKAPRMKQILRVDLTHLQVHDKGDQ